MPKPPPAPLPSHLSYKSALVLLPPASVQPAVERIREKHDRNFHRWPPHINLIYPFLTRPAQESESISDRLAEAVKTSSPVHVEFRNASYFQHSKNSATVYLEPTRSRCHAQLVDLQSCLKTAFPECDADTREFTPHLSIGQARGSAAAVSLMQELNDVIQWFVEAEAPVNDDPQSGEWSLQWTASRLYVLERHGFNGRFNPVIEVALSDSTTN